MISEMHNTESTVVESGQLDVVLVAKRLETNTTSS